MIHFDEHLDSLHLLPELQIGWGRCEDRNCRTLHVQVSLGWLLWHVGITFTLPF